MKADDLVAEVGELFVPVEAAALKLGVAPMYVRALANKGKIQHYKLLGRLVFTEAALEAYLATRTEVLGARAAKKVLKATTQTEAQAARAAKKALKAAMQTEPEAEEEPDLDALFDFEDLEVEAEAEAEPEPEPKPKPQNKAPRRPTRATEVVKA